MSSDPSQRTQGGTSTAFTVAANDRLQTMTGPGPMNQTRRPVPNDDGGPKLQAPGSVACHFSKWEKLSQRSGEHARVFPGIHVWWVK